MPSCASKPNVPNADGATLYIRDLDKLDGEGFEELARWLIGLGQELLYNPNAFAGPLYTARYIYTR